MVNSCSANGCKNRNTKGGTLTFHRFPLNNKHMLKLWLYQIKRGNWEPSKYSVICSEHFTKDSFVVKTNNRRTLKNDACPTIFNVASYTEEPKKKKGGPRERNNLMEVDQEADPEPADATEVKEEKKEDVATEKNGTSPSKEDVATEENGTSTSKEEVATEKEETSKAEESSSVNQEEVQEESQ